MFRRIVHFAFVISLIFLTNTSCKKFLSVRPPNGQLTTSAIFANDSTATAAILGIYEGLSSESEAFPSGRKSLSVLCGLSADELDNYSGIPDAKQFYFNDISPDNGLNSGIWDQLYESIYRCNSLLDGLSASSKITFQVRQQLSGEALFLRAYFYFYLINLYGSVPLSTTTTYQENDKLQRSPIKTVYNYIKNDLITARQLLTEEYASGRERIRANRSAVNALLARIYLYTHNWEQCITSATAIIGRKNQYQLCGNLTDVFLKNSSEAILQLQPTVPRYNTFDAEVFILNSIPTVVAFRPEFLSVFETADKRMTSWISSISIDNTTFYFPYKYKAKSGESIKEYLMMLRLSEQYLIRAEAYAQLGRVDNANTDINTIRERAGLSPLSLTSIDSTLQAIYKERQVELFTEWAHRWLDLKRTCRADYTLGFLKSPGWRSEDTLYPIPRSEITLNPNLTQNAGY
ncbi:RagB/SusD family nutrient uptake outer membrane protein [Chitinophaga tropicalis]|uniref:RagB/SusD family nutrient uptake outer membrane protein n=1 Tax=Chitinophaga tropicalis TaxID=2683588 RepID=A0A7K1TZY5_9BACT|nr:RagB/SusD family nutrient uptake outer membrane protein [Chitinophaga tropicalis]MVT07674.1 RagB/SusD family nutrient uptake outer membrane protein [Chitinophaga tropicalis]